jgi:serine/threonine protein kinase/predicted Zn-dependent protease
MLNPGQTLAHFRIIKLLGAGGMGEVYLAEDTKLGRKIALKILLADYFEDAERKERFYREAKTAAGISHPNVMAIHDISSAPAQDTGRELDFIVMEYIEGEPLTAYIDSSKADLKTIIRLSEQVAAGLTAAHRVNVVHRDIKADNIIIDNDGNSKILDFGLAKPVAVFQGENDDKDTDTISKELTKAGKIIGTVSYMSPEQIRGEAVDIRSDIFSFGILVYRMVTGLLPFESDTQVSTLAKILETHPEPPRLKNEQIPTELERIIDKCLQKDPNDRYQDTRDLVVDLRSLRRQYDSSISGVTSGITDRSQILDHRKSKRSFLKTTLPIALVVVLLGAVLYQIFSGTDSEGIPTLEAGENALAILGFENKTDEDSLNWLQTGLPEILLTDLAQSQSLIIISRDRVLDCLHGDTDHGRTGSIFSHPECLEAAGTLGAKHALSGAYYRLGPNIRIDARVEEITTGKIILTEKVVGDDPFVLVDSLTEKIARSLNLDDTDKTRTSVKNFTSSSPEAYKTYLAGLDNFEKQSYKEAIDDFQRAIALDSTFALPYMRIGMAHVFDGHPQEGARWFALARQYQSKLPYREASLLDIYANLWLDQNYDDAFTKMEMLIRNHPDDKESRYINGLMILVFTQDTVKAFAQMDTALQLDPRYLPVLTWYTNIHSNRSDYELAIDYALRARRYCPNSPLPYQLVAGLYYRQNKFDQAIEEYAALLDQFPNNTTALFGLSNSYISKRDFGTARNYLEQVKEISADDPYTVSNCYNRLANLANWKGKFQTALDYRFKGLEQVKSIGDSSLVANAYATISSVYDRLRMPDSTLYYSHLMYEWGTVFQKIDYPLTMVTTDPANADEARPMFAKSLNEFKSRMPAGLWPLADAIEAIFNATITHDTATIIENYLEVNKVNPGSNAANERAAGYLAVLSGKYQQGSDLLSKYISGEQMTSSGFTYPYIHYLLGVAEEGLGDTGKAIEHFQEMLKFWGDPEIELEQIKDARQRLARLTS